MIATIAYRGPDLQDAAVISDTGLAHARLSIIDLSHGADQPMCDQSGSLSVVFNGEIYNFSELRATLLSTGRYSFRTHGDTEVLLALYAEHGEAMLPLLNGMFAFAIHDARDGSLFLARDRMGKKPLHYAETPDAFVFGSELKAVLAHPSVRSEMDPIALDRYLTFEYVPTPLSIIKGVRKMRPGHSMLVRKGRIVRDAAWWEPTFDKIEIGPEEASARLDAALSQATARRLMSDVPLGVFLSGGIDSSAIAYYAQKNSTTRIKTFSVGFEEASYDESSHARTVADRLGTDHHLEMLTQKDGLDLIAGIYSTLDEPFADASLIPTHLLSRSARKHVTVCLGGDGSDELLAGYPTFTADRLRHLFSSLPKGGIRALERMANLLPVSHANISFDFKVKQFLRGFGSSASHVNSLWLGGFTPAEKRSLYSAEMQAQVGAATGLEAIDDVLRGSPWATGGLDEVILVFLKTYLLDDILFKVDRASMYTSLEVRAPFMDVEVVELANSLPDHYKRRGLEGKWLLKQVMRGKLPDAIIDRPKKGFGIPLSHWLRNELRPLCEELLSPDRITRERLFNAVHVERLKHDHFKGRANNRKLLWTLMVFQLWQQQYRPTTLFDTP
jgi:asparagine synthase (glutamine-hydrolysing)